jgi:hypothetical protein
LKLLLIIVGCKVNTHIIGKMKKLFFTGLLCLFFVLAGSNQTGNESNNLKITLDFAGGEELEYALKYGFIQGGIATVKLEETTYDGKKAFHSKMDAKSTGILNIIFDVEDIYESYFSPETVLPFMSIRNIKEGDYKFYDEVIFNRSDNTIVSKRKGKVPVPEGIMDMVTALYTLRKYKPDDFYNGQIIKITTYFDDEVFPFDMRYRGKETIETPIGKYECLKFVPFVEPGRVFKSEDDMTLWLTNDNNLLPLRVRFDLLIGSFKCDLVKYSNIKFPLKKIV